MRLWDLTRSKAPAAISSGRGSSSSIRSASPSASSDETYQPLATSSTTHSHGLTHLSFYPFDADALLSSSYDHTLAISSTSTLQPVSRFALANGTVRSHAMSPIASHVLVACATEARDVRLVDLRSGAAAQRLVAGGGGSHGGGGGGGGVLAVAWSPRSEWVLASGSGDGEVRLWDVRRSAGSIGVLDMEDGVGILEDDVGSRALGGGSRNGAKAHAGACNGIAWSADGEVIVTAGADERLRVWEAATGRNMLVHFGASVRNKRPGVCTVPTIVPESITGVGRRVLLWPNEREILVGDSLNGTVLKRLRAPGRVNARAARGGSNISDRVMSVAWRAGGNVEVYSAHADGAIRAWIPGALEDDGEHEMDDLEAEGEEAERARKKRKQLDEIHRDLVKQKITFT